MPRRFRAPRVALLLLASFAPSKRVEAQDSDIWDRTITAQGTSVAAPRLGVHLMVVAELDAAGR